MRNTQVAVYGRLKPCPQDLLNQEFDLKFGELEDQIIFPSYDKNSQKRKSFRFKKIFDSNSNQEQIFDSVAKPIINDFFLGYNSMIFTYGQTGTGKTYTMTGGIGEPKNHGLIPRTIEEIFRLKKNAVIKITYCEIYNERVYDLIGNIGSESDGTRVSQLKNFKLTMFRNLTVHKVETAFDALQLLIKGNEKKMIAETDDDDLISRSHLIFSIRLELPCTEDRILHLNPILYLVDLASAENRESSSANSLDTRSINSSLLYLDDVLLALRRPRKMRLPYRNSRMTGFLKSTLGGNSVTAVIATLSLSANDIEQTLQTCQFAERLGQITVIANPNEVIIPSKKVFNPSKDIELLEKQYKFLKAQLGVFLNNQLPEEDLDEDEKEKCVAQVEKYIAGGNIIDLQDGDVRKTIYCFQLMRDEILKKAALVETSLELKLSELSFTSNNELMVETSRGLLEDEFEERSVERKINKSPLNKGKSAQGNENEPPEITATNEIIKSEIKLPEVVAKNSDSSFPNSSEEFVLIQRDIADTSELVLCIMKSEANENFSSNFKSSIHLDI